MLGLVNSLYVAPRANQAILDLEQALRSQASYEIQPRVFYEDFKNTVLYVQDVRSGTGAANWRQVFMADISDPDAPKITTAASATVVSDSTQELLMRLRNGTEDEPVPGQPQQSNISTFAITDLPFASSQQSEGHLGRLDTAIYAMPMRELIEQTHGPDGKRFQIELHKRFAYPAACLVLMLVAVPLGVIRGAAAKARHWSSPSCWSFSITPCPWSASQWAGKTRFPLFSQCGRQTLSSPSAASSCCGRWPAVSSRSAAWPAWADAPRPNPLPLSIPKAPCSGRLARLQARLPERRPARTAPCPTESFLAFSTQYVVLEFLKMFALVLMGFVLLMLVFTVFDRLSDILRNHISFTVVATTSPTSPLACSTRSRLWLS